MLQTNYNYNTLIESLSNIKKILEKKLDFIHIIFVSAPTASNERLVFNLSKNEYAHSTIDSIDSKSILCTAINTKVPTIINDIRKSFIYNKTYDNIFNFSFKRMASIPCSLPNTDFIFGTILIYRSEGDDMFDEDIIKEVQIFIFKYLAKKEQKIKDILQTATIQFEKNTININTEDSLEKANEFFSSVIHDIRTPMNATMGFLELLLEEVTPQQREYVSAAYRSSEMVVALINDVLDINKIAMGKLDINNYYFTLLEEVENTALLFYHSAAKKEIDFIFYYDPHIPYVIKSDPFRLKQIMNNLLSNAIKFTPKGGKIIMYFEYEQENDRLLFKVSDSGIGISKNAQENIFKAFSQENKETASNYGGTGLGLSISKKLAEMLGGGLFIESEKDKGSKFSISIPCNSIPRTPPSIVLNDDIPFVYLVEGAKSKQRYVKYFAKYFEVLNLPHKIISTQEAISNKNDDSFYIGIKLDYTKDLFLQLITKRRKNILILETDLFHNHENIPSNIPILRMPISPLKLFNTLMFHSKDKVPNNRQINKISKNIQVLVVDDSIINLKLTKEVITKLGPTVKTARDGKEAVNIYKNNQKPFDIIFIDKNMPILSGSDAIKQIRLLQNGEKTKIYGLTGDMDTKAKNEMLEAGADEILHKPIKIDKIKEIIQRY